MKIVRPICCGMDVHKNSIVATIGITNKKTRMTEYIQETFSTLNPDLFLLKQWLIDHKCFDACMESNILASKRDADIRKPLLPLHE